MRVLILRRQSRGGIASYTDSLAALLPRSGVQVHVEDASAWMPQKTQGDTQATKLLRSLADEYDLVHAFGYRPAWACSEAFGSKEAWLYTAWDFPKTTHRALIDKLNDAAEGLATSRALRVALERAGVLEVSLRTPGVPLVASMDRPDARSVLELSDEPMVVGMGRFVPERAFASLIQAMEDVWRRLPEARLLIFGEGPEGEAPAEPNLRTTLLRASKPDQIEVRPWRSLGMVLSAADLVVVPSLEQSFSRVAAEAMAASKPVLLRDAGGLLEMIEPGLSGLAFNSDEELGVRIAEALEMPLTLESIGNAARIRAASMFDADEDAAATARIYKQLMLGV